MKNLIKKFSNNSGLTLIEIMVVTLIITFMVGGIFMVFSAGQASWFNADTQIQMQQDLRRTLQRLSAELRQSKEHTVAADDHADIADGTGVGGTDVLKFSYPIICEAGGSLLDPVSEEIENWGVSLDWLCSTLNCMDADGDCGFFEYKYVKYSLDNNNNLKREVYDENDALKKSEVFARDITDFQVAMSGDDTNGYIYTVSVATQKETVTGRTMSAQASINVYLRN